MATLTYDPTEHSDGEFTAEEQESLQVGEQLAQEQEQLLAGKFRDAEDLEQAYIELQRKLGDPSARHEAEPETEEYPEEEDVEEAESFFDKLWEEAHTEYTEETLQALREMPPEDLAQAYLEARQAAEQAPQVPEVSDDDIAEIKGSVGGDEAYSSMIRWAGENLSEQEINMYDTVMERGDPLAMFFATQALAARYHDASGYDGQMLTGRAPAPTSADVFRSQAEVVRAMSDPRYDKDPAYRQDVYDKLERSNLEY